MLPTRLELRNFLAYRAPEPIVFEGIELACLTGANGVGKSSILDAITWSLWGRARARRDEELIHLGQNEMQAQIDFEQDGQRYRVLRRRSRAGRGGRGSLDLLVFDSEGIPRLINEDGARRTQEKINQILRLDYETFTHSAFLQQGRADAFTLKTASQRKRILADILRLDQWSTYEAAAKERLQGIAAQIDIIQHDIKRIDQEIAGEAHLKSTLESVLSQLASADEELRRAEERYRQVTAAAADLRRERESQRELRDRMALRRDEIATAQAEVQRQDKRIAGYRDTIAQSESIEAGFSQLQAAREHQSAIADQLRREGELDRAAHELEQRLATQQARLERDADVQRERIRGLEAQLEAAATADIEALRRELAALEALDDQRDEANKEVQQINEHRSSLQERKQSLTAEGRALNERLDRLRRADGASCPLCGQPLTAAHRDEMLAQLTDERDEKREQYRACVSKMDDLGQASASRQAEVDGWARQLKRLPALQQRLGALAESERLAEEANAALPGERRQLSQLEKRLASGDFGQEMRRQLEQLERQRAAIGYDPDSHADTTLQLETYAEYERGHSLLEHARRSLPEAEKIRADTAARRDAMREAQAKAEGALERAEQAIAELEEILRGEREQRAQVDATRAAARKLRERKTIVEQQLNAIEAGRASKRRLGERLRVAQHAQGLYNELRAAFGKNGLPALIIDTAIPELEAEANDLLARMTDGRLRLRLNTQREKASGGLAETLSIEIADELGARAYELYSGGEAFRINFALRIALSKLLARRAGAQLRTLFIDEGFGSQDEFGRDRLVDAINTIQSDFDLILVITHIDELRDSFPVHLLVEKTADGSKVTMS